MVHDRNMEGPFDQFPFAGVATCGVAHFLRETECQAYMCAILRMANGRITADGSLRLPASLILQIEFVRLTHIMA